MYSMCCVLHKYSCLSILCPLSNILFCVWSAIGSLSNALYTVHCSSIQKVEYVSQATLSRHVWFYFNFSFSFYFLASHDFAQSWISHVRHMISHMTCHMMYDIMVSHMTIWTILIPYDSFLLIPYFSHKSSWLHLNVSPILTVFHLCQNDSLWVILLHSCVSPLSITSYLGTVHLFLAQFSSI